MKEREILLGRLEPGSFFGEISLFNPGPTTAAVRGVSNGDLLILRRDQFDFLASIRLGNLRAIRRWLGVRTTTDSNARHCNCYENRKRAIKVEPIA